MADQMMTPEEIETLRAYGTALMGTAQQDPQMGANPYARVSALSPFVRALQAAQGRSTLNMVERTRAGQRRDLFSPTAAPTPAPTTPPSPITTGAITPPGGPQTPPTQAEGLPPGYIERLAQVEAGGDPSIYSPSRRRRGLGQFSRELERRYGITDENWTDPAVQRSAIERHGQYLAGIFRSRFNREPNAGELYLLHQQGEGGGPALLDPANAGRTAYEVLLPLYGGSRVNARTAIQNNLPAGLRSRWNTITAADFASQWVQRFNQGIPSASTPTASVTPPTAGPPPGMMRLGMGGANANALAGPKGPQLPSGPQLPPGQEIDPATLGIPPRVLQTTPLVTVGAPEGQTPPAITPITSPTTPPTAPPTAPPTTPPTGQAVQPPQQLADLIQQSIPGNTSRIQQLERMLSRAQTMSQEDAMKLRQEYDQLLGPQEKDIPGFGKATFTYDALQGRYVLDTFQPTPSVQPLTAGQVTVPNLYYYSRQQGGWRTVPREGAGTATTPPAGSNQPGTIPPELLADINRRLAGGDVVGAMAALDEYKRQTESLGSRQTTLSGIRDDLVKEAREAPAQRAGIDSLLTVLRRSNTWAGARAQDFLELRRIMTNLGWLPAEIGGRASLSNEELVTMLQTRLGSMASRNLTSRPTQFDFSQMLQVSPGLGNSPLGARVIADYMRQELDHRVELGRIISRLGPNELGRINDVIDDYYRRNPIVVTIPRHQVGGPASEWVPEMRISSVAIPRVGDRNPNGGTYTNRDVIQFVLDNVPNGTRFWNPVAGAFVPSDHATLRRLLTTPPTTPPTGQ